MGGVKIVPATALLSVNVFPVSTLKTMIALGPLPGHKQKRASPCGMPLCMYLDLRISGTGGLLKTTVVALEVA